MVAAVVGALVVAFYTGVLTRTAQVKLASDAAAARYLARGALEALSFAAGEASLPPPAGVPVSTRGPDLFSHLLSAPEVLAQPVLRDRGAEDDRAWLTARVGSGALASVDRLAKKLPEASVKVFVSFAVPPRAPGPVKDPVVKAAVMTLRAVARVRHAEEEASLARSLYVYSLLPPAGKFTLAATAAGPLATSRVDQEGHPWKDAEMPVVLIHHPADGDPGAGDPFGPASVVKTYVARSVPASDLVTAHAARGLVYLASGTEAPEVWLPLASGGAPWGEAHALAAPQDGHAASLSAKPLADQPPALHTFTAPDLSDPEVKQGCTLQGAVLPLSEEVDGTLLGPHPDPQATGDTAVSRLKLHGTAAMPSPTAVIGSAFHVLAAISDIAVDRDVTDADEVAQERAAGRRLPARDGIEPFLAWSDEGSYDADIAMERSVAEPSYGTLRPFGMQGRIKNLNAWVDSASGGRVQVASEVGHDPIVLDLTFWKYSNLFSGFPEYRRVMSKYLPIPVNLLLDLAGRPAEQSLELLRQAAFGKTAPGGWSDYVVTRFTLAHRDALHREPAVGGATWLDTATAPPDALAKLLAAKTGERWPGEPAVVVHGQKAFEQRFMVNGQLDLAGLRVIVEPLPGDAAPPLIFDRPLVVKQGGVLEVARLAAPAILAAEGAGWSPLTVRTAELTLRGHGPFEGVFVAGAVHMENVTDSAVIRGSLLTSAVPGGLPRPLVIAWDPRNDPTGEAAPASYRVASVKKSFTPMTAP